MRWRGRGREPLLSVVVPAYDVAAYLPACLDSILGATHRALDVVVVDDGSPDDSGAIAERYAQGDPRVRVVHTENRGLGAARNEGLRHVRGDLLAFVDSDDVVPAGAWATMVREQGRSGVDLVTGSIVRWETGPDGERLVEPPWMRRLHRERRVVAIGEHPEVLGDVFAWNKLFRTAFWREQGLAWPEGVRYEDQPTTTRAFLRAERFAVLPDVVYHWRIRSDGTSITQQRSSLRDLTDRWTTKQLALADVEAHAAAHHDPGLLEVFRDRVLAGDLHRYFVEIPGCDDAWWSLLRDGVVTTWGPHRSLVHSGLPPVHRLTGWLVEQDRRSEAAAVMAHVAAGGPVDRVEVDGVRHIAVPGVPLGPVPPAALALRDHEV